MSQKKGTSELGNRSGKPDHRALSGLKVIEIESGETRVCHFEESKTWDWSGTKVVRVIGAIQITSWDKLAEISRFKAEKVRQEVVVYEFPPFMLLAGG